MKISTLGVCLFLGGYAISAHAQEADQLCKGITASLAKGDVVTAKRQVDALDQAVEEAYTNALIKLIPDKVGTFARDTKRFDVGGGIPKELEKTYRANSLRMMAENVEYRADGMPIIYASFSGEGTGRGRFIEAECGESAGFQFRAGSPQNFDVGSRKATVRVEPPAQRTALLCLKGGAIRLRSETATAEQFVQFLRDMGEEKIAAFEKFFAALATP